MQKKNSPKKKKLEKHAPEEISSKKRPPKLRQVVQLNKPKIGTLHTFHGDIIILPHYSESRTQN